MPRTINHERSRRKSHDTKRIGTFVCSPRVAAMAASPGVAADVTPERLLNADKEPQNWLMNHRTYDGQRFSPLDEDQQGQRQGPQARLCGRRSAAPRATNTSRRRRSPRTASSTSPTPGACSTRSTPARATSAASSGAWTPSRRSARRIAAPPCGAISSISAANSPARIIATDKDTGKVVWETNVSDGQRGRAAHRRAARRSRTRSSSAPPAATAACATGSRRSTPRPASCCGANTPFRRRASPAARPGRTRTTPGRPAAAPCG